MPLSSADQPTSPPSPTSTPCQGVVRSLLSPGNSAILSNNQSTLEQQEDPQQLQELQSSSSTASGASSASAPSYSSMAAKTVANIKRLQVGIFD